MSVRAKSRHKREYVIETWWRGQPGRLACLSAGSPPRDFFFKPDEVDVEAFIDEYSDENCYFVPHLFKRPRRIKENAVPPKGLWADLDEIDPSTLGELEPTVAIRSSPGRFVGLWSTDQVVSEGLNRRLTYHVGADRSGWCFTKLLRLPGSRNHKYSSAPRAIVLWDDGPTYRVVDVEKRLPPSPHNDVPSSGSNRLNLGPLPKDWRAIVRRYWPSLLFTVTSPVAIGKRSAVIWKIGMTLRENGATPEEVASVLQAARCWRDKHGDNRQALQDEVRRIFDKPLRSAP
jgi:hypothetical protein